MTLALLAGRVPAQVAPATPEAKPAKTDKVTTTNEQGEEVVQLSPFQVNAAKDNGYLATNATSGTRLNAAIKDLPINLEVITNDFMRDTGATNLREALRYSSGVVLESQSDAFAEDDGNRQSAGANDPRGVTRKPGDSTTKLRGFVIEQVLRDGFRRQYSADWINIERVEVVRGPAALLYGVGSFGGVINYIPKKPHNKESTYIGATIGTNGFVRGEFDYNAPAETNSGFHIATRVTGSYQQRNDYTQYYKEKHWTVSPVFTFQPFKNTTVFLDNEFGYSKQNGVGFQNIRNNVGTSVNDSDKASRGATWLTDKYNLTTAVKIGENVDNRTFRWSGPDTYMKGPFRNNFIDITQKITDDLYFKIGAGRSDATFDSLQVEGNTHAIRGTFSGAEAGRATKLYGTVVDSSVSTQAASVQGAPAAPTSYSDAVLAYTWQGYNRNEVRDQVRAEATYKLETQHMGTHTFLLGSQYMGLTSNEQQFGTAYSYSNLWGGSAFVTDSKHYSYKNPQDYTPFRYGVQGDGLADNAGIHLYDFKKKTWDLGYYGVYQGQFFKNRLTLIGGARWDRSDANQVQHFVYEASHPDVIQGLGAIGSTGNVAPTATSPQVGLNFAITPHLSVFGLYSTGTVPNYYAYDGNGKMMAPTKAKNHEAGFKFDFLDGRISGTVSAYKITRTGQPKFIWWAPSPFESAKKGYDSAKNITTVAWYTMPSSLWHAIHETSGMSVSAATTLAKQIYPAGWHGLIDEISAASTEGDAWAGPLGSTFWNYAWQAEGPTANPVPGDTGTFYFPLVNLSDANTAKFMATIASLAGWNGNYYYDAGKPYRYGNGAVGYGNAPNGSGASVPMNDKASGWDASFILTPTENLQILVNFAHVDRKITTQTYQFVKAPYFPFASWFTSDNNYGTLDNTKTAKSVYTDVNDTSTYNQTVPDYNQEADDTPRNTASIWLKYSLNKLGDHFKGWAIGGGGQWEDNRLWFSGFSGGGSNVTLVSGKRELVKLYTKERHTYNAYIEYNTRIHSRYDLRVALNVDNIFDDKDAYGYIYAQGISARLSTSIRF